MNYRILTDLSEIQKELSGTEPVAFDFETAPDDPYRMEPRAALDPHRSHIAGCSFSTKEGDAFYVPVAHRAGRNTPDPDAWGTTRHACADSDYTLRLYYKFNAWFDRYLPRHRWIVEHLESPTAVYVGMMKYNGILMDRPLMESKQEICEEKIAEYRKKIDAMTDGSRLAPTPAQGPSGTGCTSR